MDYVETYKYGLPVHFIDRWLVELYNGRARDIHGKIIEGFDDKTFAGQAIDRNDPPIYESEATFLDRHGLLTPAERRRLSPKHFKPVKISADDEEHTHDF